MPATRRRFLSTAAAAGTAFFLPRFTDDAGSRAAAAERRANGRSPDELAADEDFWFDVQQAFTIDRNIINLNNGGVSPSPRVVQDAMRRHLEFMNNATAYTLWQIQEPEKESVRRRLAAAFGCDAEEVAITRNSSESLENCLLGIDLKTGDEVLTTNQDYPRMLTTLRQRERRDGIKLRTFKVPTPTESMDQLFELFEKNLTPKTRLILISHIVNITGQIYPVQRVVQMARRRGIPVVVDGAHAFAHFCFKRDDLDCDMYGVSLHKWLTAPVGTGLLYMRKAMIKDVWPLMPAPREMDGDIRKFEEIGTHPEAGRLAIAEALAFYEGIGPQRKEARLRYLRDRWARRLSQDKRVTLFTNLKPDLSCAIATFAVANIDNHALATHLWDKYRIFVTPIDHEDFRGIRVTPNVYTMASEVDLFARAVEDVLARGLPTSSAPAKP